MAFWGDIVMSRTIGGQTLDCDESNNASNNPQAFLLLLLCLQENSSLSLCRESQLRVDILRDIANSECTGNSRSCKVVGGLGCRVDGDSAERR